jgi:hypothetical protein
MRLLLLEKNKDKKGNLLETIVKVLLASYGYDYVATNEIGAGGNEIDVVAEKKQIIVGGVKTYPLICECKAHESPINMNDWLKFLGKVYKEKRKNSLSSGLMIALSDANGNVKGEIRNDNNQEEVKLITGNELIEPIIQHYGLVSNTEITNIIKHWTNLTITERDVAFYNNTPYWIVYFTDGTFTILNKDGQFLEQKILNTILSAFISSSTYTKDNFIDIRRNKVVEAKKKAIKDIAIWALMKSPLSYKQISEQITLNSGDQLHVDDSEIDKCLKELDFIHIEDNVARLKPIQEINKIEFYRSLLALGIPTKLYNSFYMEHIDGSLLDSILSIHGELSLANEERNIVLFILKHSPSALNIALYPNPLFSPKSRIIGGDTDAMHESIKSSFIQTLANCLEVDADSDISMLLFDKLELRDFYKQTNYQVVLKDGTRCTIPVSKRLYYIPFKDDEGGVVVQASKDFIGQYDKETGYMIGAKMKNKKEKTLFGIVKHKTGCNEEYLALFD